MLVSIDPMWQQDNFLAITETFVYNICHSWLIMLAKITILISKDHDIDIYNISRYIAKTVVLLSPSVVHVCQRRLGKDILAVYFIKELFLQLYISS